MIIRGLQCRRVNHITYRECIDGDVDKYGKPQHPHNLVFVYKSKCGVLDIDGQEYLDPTTAPAIPVSNTRTNAGYGVWTKHDKPIWFGDVLTPEYYTAPFYTVIDGKVYRGTKHLMYPPHSYFLQQGYPHKQAYNMARRARNAK